MIKVCIISHAYIDSQQCGKIEELAKRPEISVSLITPKRGIEYGNQTVTASQESPNYEHRTTQTLFTGKLNTFIYRHLQQHLREIQPDIIQIEEEYWSNAAFFAVRAAKKACPDAKIILQTCENLYHDWRHEGKSLYQSLRLRIFEHLQKKVFNNVDAIFDQEAYITGSNRTALTQHGYQGKRFALPQLGIDPQRFQKPRRTTKKPFRVTLLGRLVPEKGIRTALKAFRKISPQQARLRIIGNGPLENEIRAQIETDKLKHIELSRALSPASIPQLLATTDILLVPSKTTPEWVEQFGRVILEGIAANTIVIGSKSGSIQYLIPKESQFDENSPDEIVDLVELLINNKDECASRLIKQRLILDQYTNKKIASLASQIYKSLL